MASAANISNESEVRNMGWAHNMHRLTFARSLPPRCKPPRSRNTLHVEKQRVQGTPHHYVTTPLMLPEVRIWQTRRYKSMWCSRIRLQPRQTPPPKYFDVTHPLSRLSRFAPPGSSFQLATPSLISSAILVQAFDLCLASADKAETGQKK